MVLNTPIISDWVDIRRRKQQQIYDNNKNENKNRKVHSYKVREKLLVHDKKENKYEDLYKFPSPRTKLWKNELLPYIGAKYKNA